VTDGRLSDVEFDARPGLNKPNNLPQVSVLNGALRTTLTSVLPKQKEIEPAVLQQVLRLLNWDASELDCRTPPTLAFAGEWHLVIAVSSKDRLDQLEYDFEGLKAQMDSHQLTTLQLVWQESDAVFHARNPFPVGGIVEDPATGAALGGYLRIRSRYFSTACIARG